MGAVARAKNADGEQQRFPDLAEEEIMEPLKFLLTALLLFGFQCHARGDEKPAKNDLTTPVMDK